MIGSVRSGLLVRRVSLPTPVAAYGFNEGSGTTSSDSSGNGHTLTLNTATWAVGTGHTSSGLTNTSATIGASSAFTAPATAITLMGWIKPLDLTAGTTKFAFGFIDTGGNTDVGIFTQRADFGNPNVLQCDIRIGASLSAYYGSAMTVGTWTHVALTYSGVTVIVYQNGTQVASASITGAISPGNVFNVAGWNSAAYDTDVIIDDVRIFNTALTQPQVAVAMNTAV
jgi:hypothetical protein